MILLKKLKENPRVSKFQVSFDNHLESWTHISYDNYNYKVRILIPKKSGIIINVSPYITSPVWTCQKAFPHKNHRKSVFCTSVLTGCVDVFLHYPLQLVVSRLRFQVYIHHRYQTQSWPSKGHDILGYISYNKTT